MAVASGTAVALLTKGTKRHRLLGWAYLLTMLGLNATALVMYRLTGTFNFFHGAALLSLASLTLGMLPTRGRPFAGFLVARHAYFMSGSYVGVLAATAAEIAVRLPGFPFSTSVIGATVLVCALGGWVMNARIPHALQNLRRIG